MHSSARREDGSYAILGAARLVHDAFGELKTMLVPLQVAGVESFGALDGRLCQLELAAWPAADAIAAEAISRLTSGRRGGSDSLHLVVMDAHRDLNQLAGSLATGSISGALVYGIQDDDRVPVGAFAGWVERTQRLRFDHPGLGTVATRNGDTLVVQNDIGETEAHVVVVKVVQRSVTVIYTDVHLPRLLFFQRMLAGHDMQWEDTRSRMTDTASEDLYHLAVGRFDADSEAELTASLELLGSRIVFLINWNKARKRLRTLVGGGAGVKLLEWAAEHD